MFSFINTGELSTVKGNRALNLYFYSSLYVHEYITISQKVLFFSLKIACYQSRTFTKNVGNLNKPESSQTEKTRYLFLFCALYL